MRKHSLDLSHFNYIYQHDIYLCTDCDICDLENIDSWFMTICKELQICWISWFYPCISLYIIRNKTAHFTDCNSVKHFLYAHITMQECFSDTTKKIKLIKINHVHCNTRCWHERDVLMSEPRDIKYCESCEHIL